MTFKGENYPKGSRKGLKRGPKGPSQLLHQKGTKGRGA